MADVNAPPLAQAVITTWNLRSTGAVVGHFAGGTQSGLWRPPGTNWTTNCGIYWPLTIRAENGRSCTPRLSAMLRITALALPYLALIGAILNVCEEFELI